LKGSVTSPRIGGQVRICTALVGLLALCCQLNVSAETNLPIADAHVHYSHDSVDLTPPERVIELMREAQLKFALVSSSDDNGTQLLSQLAPDLIVPGLRPYRRRGELNTWFKDPLALAYVEKLLQSNRYATLGEFHLYGADAELPIPRRIVALATENNLVLHAHSDADAVERLLAQNDNIKVLWAHSGFDDPETISAMLTRHDRLWADLAFRSEVGSGGSLSDDWKALFINHPTRMMLGTDTYTPERMYFLPDHANSARVWLKDLPAEVAENVAWKNAWNLLMPIWQQNRIMGTETTGVSDSGAMTSDKGIECTGEGDGRDFLLRGDEFDVLIGLQSPLTVSESFAVSIAVCGASGKPTGMKLDVTMPAHGHGMNYSPRIRKVDANETATWFVAQGLVLHMPGTWQWKIDAFGESTQETLTQDFQLK